ncbi:MAG: ABC transporter permease [Deltaproteobacteria bacterium]|nr:ABC transporter permease [Deltaproteobacteria bacterium]
MEQLKVRLPQLGALALIVALWVALTGRGVIHPLILPAVPSVLDAFVELIQTPETYQHLRVTFYEFAVAFAVSLSAGLAAGCLLGWVAPLGVIFGPLLQSIYAIPVIIFYPLCILIFGIGPASKMAFAGFYGFFPIAITCMEGVRNIDPNVLVLTRSLGAPWYRLWYKVIIPSAVPTIVAGVRLGLILTLIAVVAGEMIAAKEGIGSRIAWASEIFNAPALYAYILFVILLIAVINGLLAALERRVQWE